MTRFRRDAVISSDNKHNRDLIAAAIPDQYKMSAEWKADPTKAMANLAAAYKLKLDFNPRLSTELKAEFLKDCNKWTENGGAYLIGYRYDKPSKNDVGHAIALYRGSLGYYVFDPNIGGYRMTKSNINSFVDAYLRILKEKHDWAYKSAEMFPYVLA
jgi:hypothetical protein